MANIDPLDVGALERSVNDSAGRVSGLWLSFVAFSAYVAAAASMITHRQIFLEEPIKLPTINIDLPLVASAVLLPFLFVIYHVYVLLQVVLLARTADAYNQALERNVAETTDRTLVRQRLANTLFAQMFAGSSREREGVLGWLLRLMAWITLAIAPVLVLLVFEVKFLPYHSAIVTWTHRALIALDLLAVLLLWAGAVKPRDDIGWRTLLASRLGSGISVVLMIIGLIIASFPGEWHADWFRGFAHDDPTRAAECQTVHPVIAGLLPASFDRIALTGMTFVDGDKLAGLEKVGAARGLQPYEGERTHSFRGRDFRCGNLGGADLRRASLAGADLSFANLASASLQGTNFDDARLEGTSLASAQLQGASFWGATLARANVSNAALQNTQLKQTNLKNAVFDSVVLPGASFSGANLLGVSFKQADLKGARFDGASLQGADFTAADLRGANFRQVKLAAANFTRANLQGAMLEGDLRAVRMKDALLQGARLNARLRGADLQGARLGAARLDGSDLTLAYVAAAYLWGAGSSDPETCAPAQVVVPLLDPYIDPPSRRRAGIGAGHDDIERFITQTSEAQPEESAKALRDAVTPRFAMAVEAAEARSNAWIACAAKAAPKEEYDRKLVSYLIELACADDQDGGPVANGIARYWINGEFLGQTVILGTEKPQVDADTKALSRGLLGLNGKPCPGAARLDGKLKDDLRKIADSKPAN